MNSTHNSASTHSPIEHNFQEEPALVSRELDAVNLSFATNPQPRCPVALLLDCSSSMSGAPIQELQAGVSQFYEEIASDPISRLSVEVCVIPFGQDVKVIRHFEPALDSMKHPRPWLTAGGYTPLGLAMTFGLQEISARRRFYRDQGLAAYKPWIVLLTDGQPNDDWQEPAAKARGMAAKDQLHFMGVGIGSGVDMNTLTAILPADNPPHQLAGLQFKEFFRWLTDSLKIVTSGSTTQQRALPTPADYDWKL